MTTDDKRREQNHRPVLNAQTAFVRLPANAVAGTAEDLAVALRTLGVDLGQIRGLFVGNQSGATMWLRGAGAGAGTGVPIFNNNALQYFGWDEVAANIFYEASAAVDVMVVTS